MLLFTILFISMMSMAVNHYHFGAYIGEGHRGDCGYLWSGFPTTNGPQYYVTVNEGQSQDADDMASQYYDLQTYSTDEYTNDADMLMTFQSKQPQFFEYWGFSRWSRTTERELLLIDDRDEDWSEENNDAGAPFSPNGRWLSANSWILHESDYDIHTGYNMTYEPNFDLKYRENKNIYHQQSAAPFTNYLFNCMMVTNSTEEYGGDGFDNRDSYKNLLMKPMNSWTMVSYEWGWNSTGEDSEKVFGFMTEDQWIAWLVWIGAINSAGWWWTETDQDLITTISMFQPTIYTQDLIAKNYKRCLFGYAYSYEGALTYAVKRADKARGFNEDYSMALIYKAPAEMPIPTEYLIDHDSKDDKIASFVSSQYLGVDIGCEYILFKGQGNETIYQYERDFALHDTFNGEARTLTWGSNGAYVTIHGKIAAVFMNETDWWYEYKDIYTGPYPGEWNVHANRAEDYNGACSKWDNYGNLTIQIQIYNLKGMYNWRNIDWDTEEYPGEVRYPVTNVVHHGVADVYDPVLEEEVEVVFYMEGGTNICSFYIPPSVMNDVGVSDDNDRKLRIKVKYENPETTSSELDPESDSVTWFFNIDRMEILEIGIIESIEFDE